MSAAAAACVNPKAGSLMVNEELLLAIEILVPFASLPAVAVNPRGTEVSAAAVIAPPNLASLVATVMPVFVAPSEITSLPFVSIAPATVEDRVPAVTAAAIAVFRSPTVFVAVAVKVKVLPVALSFMVVTEPADRRDELVRTGVWDEL